MATITTSTIATLDSSTKQARVLFVRNVECRYNSVDTIAPYVVKVQ